MDRRNEPRVNSNDSVRYRMLHTDSYKTGVLRNISTHGALLWLSEDFAVNSSLEVLIRSHEETEHVHMRVVRTEETNRKGYTGYGCRIEMTISETSEFALNAGTVETAY